MALFYKRGAEGSEISCYHFNRNPNTPLHLPIESGQALLKRGIFFDVCDYYREGNILGLCDYY